MSDWKDTTSYSRSDPDKSPSSWTFECGSIRLTVHRHIHYGDAWLLSCRPTIIADLHRLNAENAKDAKEEALKYVRAWLRNHLEQLPTPAGQPTTESG